MHRIASCPSVSYASTLVIAVAGGVMFWGCQLAPFLCSQYLKNTLRDNLRFGKNVNLSTMS